MTRSRAFDLALTAALVVVGQLEAWLGPYDDRAVLAAASALVSVPLAHRRARPLHTAITVGVLFAAGQAVHGSLTDLATGTMPILVAVYTAAAYESRARATAGGVVCLVCAWVSVIASPQPPTTSNFVYATLVVGVAWTAGRLLSRRHSQVVELEARNTRDAAEAVQAERARIARELHDVVAHGVSLMVLQAGAAEQVLDKRPEQAREVLASVQSTGRAALLELRRMLDLLRAADEVDGPLEPQPGLGDLERLVSGAASAGLPTALHVDVRPESVPPALALTTYRIVQEALTNAVRHSGAREAEVTVRGDGDWLVVEVTDDGRGAGRAVLERGGHGLTGMRERVHVFGGTLEMLDDGPGLVVRVRLPVGSGP